MVWESTDQGDSWSRIREVTESSPRNHNYVRRPNNARDPFYFFWADGDPTQFGPSHLYFGNSAGDHVWRLPYSFEGATAEPKLISARSP